MLSGNESAILFSVRCNCAAAADLLQGKSDRHGDGAGERQIPKVVDIGKEGGLLIDVSIEKMERAD